MNGFKEIWILGSSNHQSSQAFSSLEQNSHVLNILRRITVNKEILQAIKFCEWHLSYQYLMHFTFPAVNTNKNEWNWKAASDNVPKK